MIRTYFNELMLWFFLAIGFMFVTIATKGFLKVGLPKISFIPDGLKEAIAG